MKIDIGCGDNKREGFTGVDKFKTPSVDIEADLFTFPWPFESDSVEEVHCSHFFEHVPQGIRGKFMDELYRVMKVGAKATFITPWYRSSRAYQDFTHEWPPIAETSYLYFNKGWREQNKLTHGHYDLKADFDFVYGYQMMGNWNMRAEEARAFAAQHYWDIFSDLVVTLTKRP